MSKVVVTGGTGFIGSHVCVDLIEKGYEVLIIDSLVNSDSKVVKNILNIYSNDISIKKKISFIKADLINKNEIDEIFQDLINQGQEISAVIHLAGLKAVKESIEKPFSYWENNVIGAYNLLSVMDKYNCRTFVFSSSATIYDNAGGNLIDETFMIRPDNPYGKTKS